MNYAIAKEIFLKFSFFYLEIRQKNINFAPDFQTMMVR
jgi:hypothetical protein